MTAVDLDEKWLRPSLIVFSTKEPLPELSEGTPT
jgi:hypothetical protein